LTQTLSIFSKGGFTMTNRITTRFSALVTQHSTLLLLITFMFLLLFLPFVSLAADGVIQLRKTGQTKCYDTSVTEISCAGTGQDGDIQAGVAWPSPRFTDHGDGTVTDKLTGLMWIKDETKQMTWQEALDYVKTLNTASHTDWRLPNVEELRSLVDYSEKIPSLPQGQPFTNVQFDTYGYYSSTTDAFDIYDAWIVGFTNGYVGLINKSNNNYVRAVRGGQSGSFGTSTTTASPVSTTTTTTPSGTTCPAKTAMGEQAQELQPLRAFRDRIMKRSDYGSAYVALYYRNALEISSLLEAQLDLKEDTKRLIVKLLPIVQAMLAQKESMIDTGDVTQSITLLDNLSALGSPSLRADLVQLKKEMQSGRLLRELNISVAGRER
jgi:hypothetical protein